jgi:hypothetical protein
MPFNSFIGQIHFLFDFLPIEKFTFEISNFGRRWRTFNSNPTLGLNCYFFIIDDNVIIESAHTVIDSWISLVNKILVTVFEFEFIGFIGL